MEVAVSHSGYSTCRWDPWDEEPCSTHTCGDRPGKVDRPSLKPLGLGIRLAPPSPRVGKTEPHNMGTMVHDLGTMAGGRVDNGNILVSNNTSSLQSWWCSPHLQ